MNNIKKARMAAGLSQKYVATTLGVAGPSVSNWESGKTKPTPENLTALADLFGVTVDYLLCRDADPTELANMRFQMDVPLKNGDSMIPRANQVRLQAKTDKGNDLVSRLQKLSPERVQQALDYIKFLEQQEETDE